MDWVVEPLVTAARAVEILRARGLIASERQLASWRSARLIPPLRRGHRRAGEPAWGWNETDLEQVTLAVRLRESTGDLDVLRVRLWLAGCDQETDAVRSSLVAFADRMSAVVRRELSSARWTESAGPSATLDERLDAVAAKLAGMRRGSPVPRLVRQPLPERQRGIAYLLRIALGAEADPTDVEGARAAERVLGTSHGRRRALPGVDPWLDGPPEELAGAGRTVSLPALRDAATTATDDELAAARTDVCLLVERLPFLVRLLGAMTTDPNPAGWGGLRGLGSAGDVTVLLVPAVITLRRAFAGNVDEVVVALRSSTDQALATLHQLLLMNDEDFATRTAGLPPRVAAQLARIRGEFSRDPTLSDAVAPQPG